MISITPLVITFNEQENIAAVLGALTWADRVVIVDSFSTDNTMQLAKATHPNVSVHQRRFDSFAAQCNFGLTHITTPWVLSLDADYILSPGLIDEIRNLKPALGTAGYSAGFRYCIYGRPLRATLYPPRTVLYRRQHAHYRDEGHGHRVVLDGNIVKLSGKIEHDDRKPLSRWVSSQLAYSKIEAHHLLTTSNAELSPQDRLRLAVYFAPTVVFVYLLILRGLIFDGWRGWYYVCQRAIAEMLLSLRLLIEKYGLEEGEEDRRQKSEVRRQQDAMK